MNYRNLRVGKLIREEISQMILRQLEFAGALVTVTHVAVDDKLDSAKIQVSILPVEAEAKNLKILQENQGNFQHLLAHKLNIKPMPRIQFELDPGPVNAAQVEKILLADQERSKRPAH